MVYLQGDSHPLISPIAKLLAASLNLKAEDKVVDPRGAYLRDRSLSEGQSF
jgi:hypothetical protein